MMPANLPAILRTETGCHIGPYPILLFLVFGCLDILKDQRDGRPITVLKRLVVLSKKPESEVSPFRAFFGDVIPRPNIGCVRRIVWTLVACGPRIDANESDGIPELSWYFLA